MPKYKLTIEYDGTPYYGWQRQKNFKTVQGTIEGAISAFACTEVELFAAGRTDTGVHAVGQVAHFEIEKQYPEWQVTEAINFYLKKEKIVILKTEVADKNFHARFSAKQRSYCYKILNRPYKSVLDLHRLWHIKQKLDLEKMRQATALLIGHHDFSSFRAAGCQASSPVITLDQIEIIQDVDLILIHIKARSFLYHMVRNIVGSLVSVGKENITLAEFEQIFASKDRTLAGITAPAHGLYFTEVLY